VKKLYDEERAFSSPLTAKIAQLADRVNEQIGVQVFHLHANTRYRVGTFSIFYQETPDDEKIFRLEDLPVETMAIDDDLKERFAALVVEKDAIRASYRNE